MTAPVKNNEVPNTDPYGDPYGEGDPYGYGDPYGGTDDGMVVEDEYVDGGDGSGGAMTVQGAREYLNYLDSMLKDSELDKETKDGIRAEIKALKGQINKAAGFSDPAMQQQALGSINDKLCDIENRINGVDEDGEVEGEDDGTVKGQTENIMEKADAALAAGTISQDYYDQIKDECEQANNIVDILGEEDGGAEASEHISTAMDLLVGGASSDPKTQAMADALGVSIDDLEAAAEAHNVDLENPQPNDDFFQMFAELAGLSPDEIKGAIDQRFSDMDALKSELEMETESWRADSENPPSKDKFEKSFEYFNKTDKQIEKIKDLMTAIADNPKTKAFFEAAGFSFSTGPGADQITLNGTAYDFYNNDKGTFGLSTTKTSIEQDDDLFAPAPMNTAAATNEGTNYQWFHKNDPSGYPEDEFSGE